MSGYGNIFQKNPLVVMQIFKYVSTIDLVRSQRVCKFWKKYSEIMIKKRSRKVAVEFKNFDYDEDEKMNTFIIDNLIEWRNSWNFIPSVFLVLGPDGFFYDNIVKFTKKYIPKSSKFIFLQGRDSIITDPSHHCLYYCIAFLDRRPFLSTDVVTLQQRYGKRKGRKSRTKLRNMLTDKETKFVFIMCRTFPRDVDRVWKEIVAAIARGVVVMGVELKRDLIVASESEIHSCDFVALSLGGSDVFAASAFMDEAWDDWVPLEMQNLKGAISAFECANHDDIDIGHCKNCNSQLVGFHIVDKISAKMSYGRQRRAFFEEFPKIPLFTIHNKQGGNSFGDEVNLFGRKGGTVANPFVIGTEHRGGSMAGVVFLK